MTRRRHALHHGRKAGYLTRPGRPGLHARAGGAGDRAPRIPTLDIFDIVFNSSTTTYRQFCRAPVARADGPVDGVRPQPELALQLVHDLQRLQRRPVQLVHEGEDGQLPARRARRPRPRHARRGAGQRRTASAACKATHMHGAHEQHCRPCTECEMRHTCSVSKAHIQYRRRPR